MGKSDVPKKKSILFEVIILTVTAMCSFFGAWAGSYVSVSIEKQKHKNRLDIERQGKEIDGSISEVEHLIGLYGQMIKKGANALSFLRDQSCAVDKVKTFDSSDIAQVEKEFFELSQKVSESYFHIISFYKIQIDAKVLLTYNGMGVTISAWRQSLFLQKKLSVPRYNDLFWLPEEILVLPPDDQEKCTKLLKDFEDIGRKELDYLTSFRKKLISNGGANLRK